MTRLPAAPRALAFIGFVFQFITPPLIFILALVQFVSNRLLRLLVNAPEEVPNDCKPTKRVAVASPPPKHYLPVPPPLTWCAARAIDGVRSQQLDDVSLRWKIRCFEEYHIQGGALIENWTDRLHRIRCKGHRSKLDCNTNRAVQGDFVKGALYLPVDVHFVIKDKKLVSQTQRLKIYGIRIDFGDNDDGLEWIQMAIPLGTVTMSAALQFHNVLERSLSGVDDGQEMPLSAAD